MQVIPCADWPAFKQHLANYVRKPRERRQQWAFRGQSDATWPLIPTLDRGTPFADDAVREKYYDSLLEDFKTQAVTLGEGTSVPQGNALDLLARHHGLPSPFIDWTSSPYVAAYFAFAGAKQANSAKVAIYGLDRARLTFNGGYDIVEDWELLRFNRRALHQRGLFLEIKTIAETVEVMLGSALRKYEIPTSEVRLALSDLDEMTINGTYLIADLDSAASTALLLSER